MTSDQPGQDPLLEELGSDAMEMYGDLTAMAGAPGITPEMRQRLLAFREFTFATATTTAANRQTLNALFGDDLHVLGSLLRDRLTPAQRDELAGILTTP